MTMERKYTKEDFLQLAEQGREQIMRGECFTTDEVLKLCEEEKPIMELA